MKTRTNPIIPKLITGLFLCVLTGHVAAQGTYNVLFLISDDLTARALGSYGNETCRTPHIDRLASEGTLYTRAYCQLPICGPSRASMLTGYYPHATLQFGYTSGRKGIGPERETWPQFFKNRGYHSARVSKIYHMGVPGDIEKGSNGPDDPASWTERHNSQGPEVFSEGEQIQLVKNPTADPAVPVRGGNTQEICITEGDGREQSDVKTAAKAVELIRRHKDKRFFLAVGMVRPHIPFVAPRAYFDLYPWEDMELMPQIENDWDDIPKAGINYRTSPGMRLSEKTEKMSLMGYYASVSFMDAQVGKVLDALREEGLEDETIVIFTSDHGFHLGDHDFWQKVGLMEDSSRVPLIIKVPGHPPAVCDSFVELVDLYPTVASLCGFEAPSALQGKDISPTLENPDATVRDAAFCVNKAAGGSFLIRSDKWAYIQHGPDGEAGLQLYDMENDPNQFQNLALNPETEPVLRKMRAKLDAKLAELRDNDLGIDYTARNRAQKKRKAK